MKTRYFRFGALLVAVFGVVCALALGEASERAPSNECGVEISTVSEDAERVVIASSGGTDFTLYFSADPLQADQTLASDLDKLARELYGVRLRAKSDAAAPENADEHEILIGNTVRAESKVFHGEVLASAPLPEDMVWGFAYENGKLLFTANSALAYEFGSAEFLDYLRENDFTVPSDLRYIGLKTRAEYDAEIEADAELRRQLRIKELLLINAAFKQSDFGGAPQQMPTDRYEDPHTYPVANQHPRYFLAGVDLDEIYYNFMENPDYLFIKNQIFAYAEAENFTGIFPEKVGASGEVYRFNQTIIAQMEAKAFMYLMTGDEIYGLEAIVGAKNAMLSLKYTTDLHMDVYHGPSQVMVNVAKVYDWCYDLLTEADKNQIIAGVSNVLGPQMENGMRFPPDGMNAVSGHGTGPQFIRDWMTVAIIFYDEMPSWWDFVGGRFYQYYVPVINVASENGWASQGTVTYGDSKYFTRSWAALLVKMTTGEFPYTEDFQKCAYYYFSYIQPNGKYFQTGDGSRSADGCGITDSCAYMFMAAALFNDPTIGAMAKHYSNQYQYFSYAFTTEMTAPVMLILRTLGPDIQEEARENIDLIQYFEAPAATMTARDSWDEDGAAVLMRMGTMTMANHDLCDHGTFQIYYKGLLAGTSGAYKKYGAYVHRYYLQATVAHNGILVFDPSLADDEPVFGTKAPCNEAGCDHTECTVDRDTIVNAARYYYSGSQRALPSPPSIESWTDGSYEMGTVLGADWEYNLDGSAKYAYIASDLTMAYPTEAASYVGRKMLTVFLDDEEMPLLFFTYDQVVSKGEDFTKYWLLHTVNEPEVDGESLSATVIEGGGRLVLQSLSGMQNITKIGGKGKDFWINGKNCTDAFTNSDAYYNKIWGRIELATTGNLSDNMFHAMYVTDSESTKTLDIESWKNDQVEYAKVLDKIVAFTNTRAEAQSKEFSFETEGKGLYEYYVSGVETGTWKVKVDGVVVANAYADAGEGMITFKAPLGKVTLTPGPDVIGANGGRIKYSTGGGKIEGDYPLVYQNDTVTPLPQNVVKKDCIFLGWYLSPNFEPETHLTEIPMGLTGTVNVYAKWLSNILNVDYNTTPNNTINAITNSPSVNGIKYNLNSSQGASFISKRDEDGTAYLEWCEGAGAPFFTTSNATTNYASMSSNDECASFTVTLSRNGDAPIMGSQFRIYTRKDVNGNEGSDFITRQYIFTVNEKGEVRLGDSAGGPVVTVLTEEKTTLRVVMDFKNEEIRAHDDYGNIVARTSVKVKELSGAANMSEWRKLLDSIIFYWMSNSSAADASMKIYSIKIDEGDRFKDMEPEDGIIVYGMNGGGTLPSGYPKYYSKEAPTELPLPSPIGTNVFRGWYTTPTFDEGTEISEIPADTTGAFFVYAKWSVNVVNENYLTTNINISSGDAGANGIAYKINQVAGASFITKTAPDGTRYLEWHEGGGAGNPFIIMTNGAIAASADNSISYEFTFSKNGDDPLPSFYMRTLAKVDVNGDKLATNNNLPIFKVVDSGVYLADNCYTTTADPGDIKISDITDSKITVRVVIDFDTCQVKAYTDDGSVLVRNFKIPESSGAKTGAEYRSTFTEYTFYMMTTSPTNVTNASLRIHNFKIDTGNVFESSEAIDGKIAYFTGGGVLPKDAPLEYSKETPTVLPIPTLDGYVFEGWYTSASFAQGTEISVIPATQTGAVYLYAKWSKLPDNGKINYNLGGGKLPTGAPERFNLNGTTVLPTPIKDNAVFKGWYTTEEYEEGTLVTFIPAGTTGEFTVFAKWISTVISEDYSKTEVSVPESTTQAIGGINYNAGSAGELKPGSCFKTVDEDGNVYLKAQVEAKNAVINVVSSTYNLTHFTNTAISYEFDLKKLAGMSMPDFTFRLTTSGGNLGSFVIFVMNGTTGEIKLQGSDKVFATVTEELTTVRIVIDFATATISAYGDGEEKLDAVHLDVPTVKAGQNQPATLVEWQKVAANYLFYGLMIRPAGVSGAVAIGFDNLKIVDGRVFGKSEDDEAVLPEQNPESIGKIVYETNGGTLPEGTSDKIIAGEKTPLATPSYANGIFDGWYTSATFEEGTLVTEVPADVTGEYKVFAKWLKIISNEDYSSTELDLFEKSASAGGLNYNGGQGAGSADYKVGAAFKTVTDAEGNKYLLWQKGEKDPIIHIGGGAVAKLSEHTVSYEITFRRNGDSPFLASTARTMAQYDVNGVKLSSSAKIYIFGTTSDGAVYLSDKTSKVIGTVPTDGSEFTVRVVIDYENLKVIAYLDGGETVSADITIPKATGAATGLDYQKLMTTYVFCWQGSSGGDPLGEACVESIRITEGNAFAN